MALALAARRPDLVQRVAAIATPAPDEEVPWIPEENRAGLDALRGIPPQEVRAGLSAAFAPVLDALTGDARLRLVGVGDADATALAVPGVSRRLEEMLDLALAQGPTGMVDDIAGYCLRPWGLRPAEVPAKVLLRYGTADPVTGHAHGAWWQRSLPDARLEMTPGVGHLAVVPAWARVLSHLVPRR